MDCLHRFCTLQCRLTAGSRKSYGLSAMFCILYCIIIGECRLTAGLGRAMDFFAMFCILHCTIIVACRIAAGGDKRFRQSRLGADDSFRQDDDSLEDKDDFAKFDEPTRIEGEGGDVDPDPGDRESVRGLK
jgi:thiosulfate reductase cytochrome b subunit